jgi:cysteine-rich repeat protein
MRVRLSFRPGVTFIELLMFIAIVSATGMILLPLFFSSTENTLRQESISIVENAGTTILDSIGYDIRHALSVTTPVTGAMSGRLVLQTVSPTANPTVFFVDSGSLIALHGAVRTVLNPPDVRVIDFQARNTSGSPTSQSILISFTLSRTTRVTTEFAYQQKFEALNNVYPRGTLASSVSSSSVSSVCSTTLWTQRESVRYWSAIAISATGQRQTALVDNNTFQNTNGNIYISSDYGVTWTPTAFDTNWMDVAMSDTGQYQTAVSWGGRIYVSSDYGNTWTQKGPSFTYTWNYVAMSTTGQYQLATSYSGDVYTSSNYGNTWTDMTGSLSTSQISDIAVSSDGQYQVVTGNGSSFSGVLHISSDYGSTWLQTDTTQNWSQIIIPGNGSTMLATSATGLYVSSNYGSVWTLRSGAAPTGIESASDGLTLVGISSGGAVLSTNGGVSWTLQDCRAGYNVSISKDGNNKTGVKRGGYIYTSATVVSSSASSAPPVSSTPASSAPVSSAPPASSAAPVSSAAASSAPPVSSVAVSSAAASSTPPASSAAPSSAAVSSAPTCGNGNVQPLLGEQCDDGGAVSGNGCSALCRVESNCSCWNEPSTCQCGGMSAGNPGPSCGNGNVQPSQSEQCDDGNNTNGDGCSSVCTAESNCSCIGNPSTCYCNYSSSVSSSPSTSSSYSSASSSSLPIFME